MPHITRAVEHRAPLALDTHTMNAKRLFVTLIASLAATSINAEEITAYPEIQKAVSAVSGLTADGVTPPTLPGLYEVTAGSEVFYATKDGKYILQGDLLDVAGKRNLTEDKRSTGRIKLLSQVDEKDMIVFSPKQVKHTVTIFTDIDCPYCRQLHSEMKQMNALGIKVRYLAFPRAGLESDSYRKFVSVWCAKDRNAALTNAKAGKSIPPHTCANPIAQQFELGQKVGVSGTPSLVLENGSVIPGYVPPQRLAGILDNAAKKAAAKN